MVGSCGACTWFSFACSPVRSRCPVQSMWGWFSRRLAASMASQDFPACCQAVEWELECLLPPDLSSPGHAQGTNTPGFGQSTCLRCGPLCVLSCCGVCGLLILSKIPRSLSLLRPRLSPSKFCVIPCSNGFRNFLSLCSMSMLVTFCFVCRLIFTVSQPPRVPRAVGEERSAFTPMLEPFAAPAFWADGNLLLVGTSAVPVAACFPHPLPQLAFCRFLDSAPSSESVAGLVLVVPFAPISLRLLWEPASCTLRGLRAYSPWLMALLSWISTAVALARLGKPLLCTISVQA